MIIREIFLIWTLVAGEVKDVDAFLKADDCAKALVIWGRDLEGAKTQRPDLENVTFEGCTKVSAPAPANAI